MPKKLSTVLKNIRPEAKVIEIDHEEFEFSQLHIGDFSKIEEKTGIDLTREMMKVNKSSSPEDMFSSKIINWILFLSMKKSKRAFSADLTLGDTAELISYGLKGEVLGDVLVWALSGLSQEEAAEAAGGSGNG